MISENNTSRKKMDGNLNKIESVDFNLYTLKRNSPAIIDFSIPTPA